MKAGHKIPCRTKSAVIIVNDYRDGVLVGLLLHPRLEEAQSIHSISQLLLHMDSLLNLEECPGNPAPLVCPEPACSEAIATLQIQVLFRERHLWQGRLIWMDENREIIFRSVIELMQIMDDILAR